VPPRLSNGGGERDTVCLSPPLAETVGVVRHLYAHIPFCPKVCPYCSFYKEASDRNKTAAFLDTMLGEAGRLAPQLQPATIFFGGGTPSALGTNQLDYLLSGLRQRLDLSRVEEWTLEMNPATVSLEKAAKLLELGVNRISMGVQSWDPALLEKLGRVHSAEQAERSYRILREAGVGNINLDLIFGIPGQSIGIWRESLERTIALGPEHISAYCLTYEEDTEFFLRHSAGEMTRDEEVEAEFFEVTMDVLEAAGYPQYEISNYAKPGRECRHNLAYWEGADYLGLGPSAFSTLGDRRWRNVQDTARYIASAGAEHDFEESLDGRTRLAERIAFSLRTRDGADLGWLSGHADEVRRFTELGLLQPRGNRLALTRRGRLLADSVAEAFV